MSVIAAKIARVPSSAVLSAGPKNIANDYSRL